MSKTTKTPAEKASTDLFDATAKSYRKKNNVIVIDGSSDKSMKEQLEAQKDKIADFVKATLPQKPQRRQPNEVFGRVQRFFISASDLQALELFTADDEGYRHQTGVHLGERSMTACDGKRLLDVAYNSPENVPADSDYYVSGREPQDFFQPVTLSSDFVRLFIEAAKLNETVNIPVEVLVYEKKKEGELDFGILHAKAYGIERPCLEGSYPNIEQIVIPRRPWVPLQETVDARHYLDAVKALYLVKSGALPKKDDLHAIRLNEFDKGDKDQQATVGYYNDEYRIKIIINPVRKEKLS